MSRVKEGILAKYPALAINLAVLPVEEASDLRLMSELASNVVSLFEAGDVQDIPAAFQLAEQLLGSPLEAERDAAATRLPRDGFRT